MMPSRERALTLLPMLATLILLCPGAAAQITVDHPIPATATIRVDAVPAGIQVGQFAASGMAQVKTLHSNNISDGNDKGVPNRVTPVHTEESVHAGKLHYSFPHESVTVITLRKNS